MYLQVTLGYFIFLRVLKLQILGVVCSEILASSLNLKLFCGYEYVIVTHSFSLNTYLSGIETLSCITCDRLRTLLTLCCSLQNFVNMVKANKVTINT